MKPKTFAVLLGVIMLGVGLFLGFQSGQAGVSGQVYDCGTSFSPNDKQMAFGDQRAEREGADPTHVSDACERQLYPAGLVWALTVGGAVLAIGGLVIRTGSRSEPTTTPEPSP